MNDADVSEPIRILLVEDNPHDRTVFHRAFRKSEITTRITDCKRAEAALSLLAANADQFDLIVSDYGLPGSSGLDLYRQLQDQRIQLPFVLLTGVGNELLAVEALKLGVDDYVPKHAGRAYVEQLPTAITRVYQIQQDRMQKAQIKAELVEREAKEQFLSQATSTALLIAMEDYEETTAELARMPIPFFADWSLVDLFNHEVWPRQVVASHVNPQCNSRLQQLTALVSGSHQSGPLVADVLQQRQPRLITEIVDPKELFGTVNPAICEIVAALNPQSVICAPLAIRDRIIGVLWLIHSDSGRVYIERDVSFAERLGQRMAIAIENARVYASVRKSDRRKDEFLATLAHELRNPLAPVRNALEILQNSKADARLANKAIATMERQVEHLVRLVDDLLDVSRVMRGKIALRKRRVRFTDIVQRALETSHSIIEQRRHELVVNFPDDEVWLEVDEVRIAQVLANLLTNAAKYTNEGGHIWLQCEMASNTLCVRVRDDGIGMEPSEQAHIFDLFRQVESSLESSNGGLGIGLTLVRRLTEMHGGVVLAHSDGLGQGSEFVVRLPVSHVVKRHDDTPRPPVPNLEPTTGGLRILVVDDNLDAAEMMCELLRLDGHDVQMAHDGQAACEKATERHPHVILLDIGLPGMNGYEVTKQLRCRQEFRQTTIIAVTGYGQPIDRQRARAAGFDLHLVKPVPPKTIQEILARCYMAAHESPNSFD